MIGEDTVLQSPTEQSNKLMHFSIINHQIVALFKPKNTSILIISLILMHHFQPQNVEKLFQLVVVKRIGSVRVLGK